MRIPSLSLNACASSTPPPSVPALSPMLGSAFAIVQASKVVAAMMTTGNRPVITNSCLQLETVRTVAKLFARPFLHSLVMDGGYSLASRAMTYLWWLFGISLLPAPWRERLFATLSRNAGVVVDFFRIPVHNVIELGTRIQPGASLVS